jgi:hypothetical protein
MGPLGVAPMSRRPAADPRAFAVTLWLLAALFFLRVLGQGLVAFFHVGWLPAMGEWYSGLLPYPLLLPAQILILAVMLKVGLDFSRGAGWSVVPRPTLAPWLVGFSAAYFAVMAVRYALTMALHPERRWLGTGTIPIVFHWVLAGYLLTLGRYYATARVPR